MNSVDTHPNSTPARATPEWFRKAVMYQIQPRAFTPEGTIRAAEGKLPELAEIGVTCVYMCPVTVADDDPREEMWSPRQVKSGFGNPRNPYRTGDYFHVDPEYGTDDDLRSFIRAAHSLGMKVLLDVVYLHCGPSARPVKEHPEYFSYDKDGKIVMAGWRFPKLDFDNPGVREYFIANMVYWLADFDADGFRCDVADGVPLDFWESARDACERVKRGIVILAEGCRYENTLHAFDANYNWPVCLSWLRPILKGDTEEGYNQQWAAGGADVSAFKGVRKLRAASEQYAAKCPAGTLNMNFTENHDTVNDDYDFRMEKRCGCDNQTLGLALCFAMDGIPLVYNGQEIADARRHSIFGHAPEVTVDWSNAATPDGRRRREMVRALAALRRDNPCMTEPGQTWLDNDAPERVLSLRRGDGPYRVTFVGNFSPEPVRVRVDGADAGALKILLANGAKADGGFFLLGPWGFAFAMPDRAFQFFDRRDPAAVWDLARLHEKPEVREWPSEFKGGVTPIMIAGEPYRGRETWCFAYYGVPEWATPAKKAPAIVLVHGGLGTAYPEWVRMWVKRGYAAICVDTCGALPIRTADGTWLANPEGGPQGWSASIAEAGGPERDQWVYHAVAAVMRSHSFIRSLDNVDTRAVGVTGISWGGFLTCILAAADDRFAYAVPVYGCGFNYERPGWINGFDNSLMTRWARLWDASCYLSRAKCPMMWVDGTNDFAFSLDRVRRSAALAAGVPHVFSTHLRMVHGHGEPGEGPREILAFADFFARGGADVVRVGECRRSGRRIEVPFQANGRGIARAELMFTKDGPDVRWDARLWQTEELRGFDAASGKVVAELPEGAFAWIVNLATDDGLVFSSPYEESAK